MSEMSLSIVKMCVGKFLACLASKLSEPAAPRPEGISKLGCLRHLSFMFLVMESS